VALKVAGDPERRDDDHEAADEIHHVVVRGDDDREPHRGGAGEGESAERDAAGRAPDGDADQHVPAEVQAREGRVLVREAGRLESAVGARLVGDGVDERAVDETGRRQRQQREEEEADRARDHHRVAEQQVAVTRSPVEQDARGDDHRPVAPDVDPVEERHGPTVIEQGVLERPLPVEPETLFELRQPLGVRERLRRRADRQVADAEVGESRERDERHLADERVRSQVP
jgi:hypothetical protein